jgi:hypothetical protein
MVVSTKIMPDMIITVIEDNGIETNTVEDEDFNKRPLVTSEEKKELTCKTNSLGNSQT